MQHKGGGEIAARAHNVKAEAVAASAEVEFYAQTQQLIYGRTGSLFCAARRTVEALTTLAEAGHINETVADELNRIVRIPSGASTHRCRLHRR